MMISTINTVLSFLGGILKEIFKKMLSSNKHPDLSIAIDIHSTSLAAKNWGPVGYKQKDSQYVSETYWDLDYTWTIPFVLKNNSSSIAYHIDWDMNNYNPNEMKIPRFPVQLSLQPNEEYRFEIQLYYRAKVQQRDANKNHTKFPFYRNSIDLFLIYSDVKGKSFVHQYKCLKSMQQLNVYGKTKKQCYRRIKRQLNKMKY